MVGSDVSVHVDAIHVSFEVIIFPSVQSATLHHPVVTEPQTRQQVVYLLCVGIAESLACALQFAVEQGLAVFHLSEKLAIGSALSVFVGGIASKILRCVQIVTLPLGSTLEFCRKNILRYVRLE